MTSTSKIIAISSVVAFVSVVALAVQDGGYDIRQEAQRHCEQMHDVDGDYERCLEQEIREGRKIDAYLQRFDMSLAKLDRSSRIGRMVQNCIAASRYNAGDLSWMLARICVDNERSVL